MPVLPLQSGAALRNAAFRRYQLVRLFGVLGLQMQGVAVGWQVYAITGRPMDLGYVGLVQFLPNLLLWPFTGTLIDRYDRRKILLVALFGYLAGAVALTTLAAMGSQSVAAVYVTLFFVAIARAFWAPAGQALLPQLVPPEDFANAVTWSSILFQAGAITGPALGGLAYAATGRAEGVYAVAAGLLAVALGVMATVPQGRPIAAGARPAWPELLDGLRFIFARPIILGAITLDLFAVLLGGAVALLPVYARDILHTGPEGLGWLRAAPAVGAVGSALLLARWPIRRRAGMKLFTTVAIFGLATIAFGLSTSFWLSLVALVLVGASDEISVVIRQTVLQINTPDEMRGRVSAVNFVFIGMSNEIGELESGFAATVLGTVPAVVAGGVGTLLVVLAGLKLAPELRKVDRLS